MLRIEYELNIDNHTLLRVECVAPVARDKTPLELFLVNLESLTIGYTGDLDR